MKETAQRIFRSTLAAIDIPATIEKKLARSCTLIDVYGARIDLAEFDEIVAIAFGKASVDMAQGLVRVIAPEIRPAGILVAPSAPPVDLLGWKVFVGGHPIPSDESFAAGRAILDQLARCDELTLIFFLISGGGSAMVEQPLDPAITLDDFRALHAALVTCGAPIEDMNAVRKHLSATKGGRLATAAPHSMKITLGVSDVPPGQESALASGPTLPDPTTVDDVIRVVAQYDLAAKVPPGIRKALDANALRETPKPGDAAFARSHFVMLLSEDELLHAARYACEAEGYICVCDGSTNDWPAEKAADYLPAKLEALAAANPGKGVAILADGELSSPVTGDGIGGRNAAFVLACVEKIGGKEITVLSAGTDGIDGNSAAAGAVADGETAARARAAGLDPRDFQRRSDSHRFFSTLGDAIVTGPTGNNLRDLRILLSGEPQKP
ncbi:MAG: glycerate kinase type-2 family protein [Candidatus Acidiferrales bacterium]